MIELSSLLVAVLGGLTEGVVGEFAGRRRHRQAQEAFQAQQEYLETLRRQERELQQAERRARDELRQAHQMRMEAVRGLVTVASQRLVDRDRAHMENSPFNYDLEHSRQLVEGKAGGRPAVIFAPFYNESHAGPVNEFGVALRRTWDSLQWARDLEPIGGLFKRPLRHADVDLMLVRQTLAGLPVVLVHGDVQAGRRVWTSLHGWGLVPNDPDAEVRVDLPWLTVPAPGQATDEQVLAFQDELARVCGTVAGVLGDWYHLLQSGRRPQVHLNIEDPQVRRSIGAALAAAYEAVDSPSDPGRIRIRLEQARVLAESGLRDSAVTIVSEVLASARHDPEVRRRAEQIGELLRASGADVRVLDLSRQLTRKQVEIDAEFWTR